MAHGRRRRADRGQAVRRDIEAFEQLRVAPYYRIVMARHPALSVEVAGYIDRMLATRRCLVHGDFSPKNVLVGTDGLWVLDFEVAHLGANAVLAVSISVALAAADATGLPLHRVVSPDAEPLLPLPMVNILSGGAHAGGAVDVQDIPVVPVGAASFAEAIGNAWALWRWSGHVVR